MVLLAVVFLSGCTSEEEVKHWYGFSDRYGFLVVSSQSEPSVVVLTIPMDTVTQYQRHLADSGVEADLLGIIQHLFGLPADHYVRGNKGPWDELARSVMEAEGLSFSGIRPSVEAFVQLLITHGELLSKDDTLDTLQALAGVRTDAQDIAEALLVAADQIPQVSVYHTEHFLPSDAPYERIRTWVQQWTLFVLQEELGYEGELSR
jgi:hypothetical protein